MQPLVSVICLCYNHSQFLWEGLDSVRSQTYPHLEIIVVDDASTDNSPALLQQYQKQHPEIKLILHRQNTGNCRAFNEALALAAGEYIIDFATDDVLLPGRVTEQVQAFQQLDSSYGVIYTDAELINEKSQFISNFYKRDKKGKILSRTPSGYILADILRSSFICPPTLMFRRILLEKLKGYDETLAYEDFDIWVRSAPFFQFYYLDKILTRRRLHPHSLSRQLYKPGDKQLISTVKICHKALNLVQTPAEQHALVVRIKSEFRQALFSENFPESRALILLLQQLNSLNKAYVFLKWLAYKQVPLGFIRRWYYCIKYNLA